MSARVGPEPRPKSRRPHAAVGEQLVTGLVVPKGRSAAERRLSAVAALHQPIPDRIYAVLGPRCGECRGEWPCATARILGRWPGEQEDL